MDNVDRILPSRLGIVQVKAIWSQILFTDRGVPPKQLRDSAAVKKAVAANPKAVGYIEKSAVDASIKVAVSIDFDQPRE